ncbi:MAG: sporulation transcriptional regulator SpoIIID [Clostridia bacterium]|nr:sporulation transcriptional regulator SpoIIID [Clostridia bacterium]
MKGAVEERAIVLGEYILENKTTVRAAARRFHISKSTVHKDVSDRLRTLSPSLYGQVREILDVNKAQRHIRGGLATREKYRLLNGDTTENE